MESRTLNHNSVKRAHFKWKPSYDFDDTIFESKKDEMLKLLDLFNEAKAKRKNEKLEKTTSTQEDKNIKNVPSQENQNNIEHGDYSDETEDEIFSNESFPVKVGERDCFIPNKTMSHHFDINNDGFDIAPEFLEVLPSDDPQAVILNKKNLMHNSFRLKNLKKRKPIQLLVDPLFHKLDKNYISSINLSKEDLIKRKKIRLEFSRVAWKKIIQKNFSKKESTTFLERESEKAKLTKKISAEAASVVTNSIKDLPTTKEIIVKARKLVYEMQTYWRKVDRESGEVKVKKTRDVITERKKVHVEKEVKRHNQRLDFLLRQTEIFSHFIGARMGIKIETKNKEGKSNLIETESKQSSNLKASSQNTVPSDQDKKAAKAAIEFMNSRKKQTREFEQKITKISGNESYVKQQSSQEDNLNEMDLLNPSTMPSKTNIKEPEMFVGTLKSYQLKGLNWLVNLYEHSINGILADEMGLGKTIQSIAFIAHLCEVENLWGPYLIIAPNSVVHNWCYEFEQFTPSIKVLPYWGAQKDRENLRKFWKSQFLYSSEGEFHVLVTSYSTFQTDEKHFKAMKWQFIILDEAHAIKNSQSQRWKSLLSLECRNRLLLTGTPIQNSMAELWALLHYIMPTIFQKHKEFKEWFSKNIEDHAEGKSHKLRSVELKRLHMILKPFMLRRVKHDVEHEMAPKKEIVMRVMLSPRQKRMYNKIKDRFKNEISQLEETVIEKDLYNNIVMQFRKVCNHPDIYQKKTVHSPFLFSEKLPSDILLSDYPKEYVGELNFLWDNPISFFVPRLLFEPIALRESLVKGNRKKHFLEKFCVFNSDYVADSLLIGTNSEYSFLKLLDFSPAEFELFTKSSVIVRWLILFEKLRQKKRKILAQRIESKGDFKISSFYVDINRSGNCFDDQENDFENSQSFRVNCVNLRGLRKIGVNGEFLVQSNMKRLGLLKDYPKLVINCVNTTCQAPPIEIKVSSLTTPTDSKIEKSILFGIGSDKSSPDTDLLVRVSNRNLHYPATSSLASNPFLNSKIAHQGLFRPSCSYLGTCRSKIETLPKDILLTDCGKLSALDKLLQEKKKNNHRVLIFSQMTKMLDILEDYCRYRSYTFLRLDGSTHITDRTIMVKQFQRDSEVFIFLLSTRAGGLGINLTSADTVIFYDNDWNPTMDAQAMDRVHRIGQKKQVTVYRLICKDTVEERIWKVAQQKFNVQTSVYSGGFKFSKEKKRRKVKKTAPFKTDELKQMILD